jgi:hypothetical protein
MGDNGIRLFYHISNYQVLERIGQFLNRKWTIVYTNPGNAASGVKRIQRQ